MPTSKRPSAEKQASRRTSPAEIAPGVFVGGWKDATRFEGERFCVLDEARDDLPPCVHVPIFSETTGEVNRRNLDRLAKLVQTARSEGKPALIFCGMGIRRGPLGGAWYLHRAEHLSLDEAYARVRAVRPQTEHARDWVPNPTGLE